MLEGKRISILGDCVINGEKIANFGALITGEDMKIVMTDRVLNEEACKDYRDMYRADRAAFEDYAYMVQDKMKEIAVSEE